MTYTLLSTTPEGLKALQRTRSSATLQGPDGFISSEIMYRDAAAAHELEAALLDLFRAAAQVHRDCSLRGKPRKDALMALEDALATARGWSWETGPRVAQCRKRPRVGTGLRKRDEPRHPGTKDPAFKEGLDRPAA